MTKPKTAEELSVMRQGGKKLGEILGSLITMAVPGEKLLSIEQAAVRLINDAGGTPSFMTVEGYSWATCICINEEVVHGIPTSYVIKNGDAVTIDIGMLYGGLHTDTAHTVTAGTIDSPERSNAVARFFQSGQDALTAAIGSAVPGNRIYDISHAIEEVVTGSGYAVVKSLVGHGIGRMLHESPQVPCFTRGRRDSSPELVTGMTLAIEVIYAEEKGDVVYGTDDGWTISTRDGGLSAVFEHTIAVGTPPEILTGRPDELNV